MQPASPPGRTDGAPGDGEPGGDQVSGQEFGDLVAAEIPGLYRYALHLVGDPAEAEDVVGDTVLRAIERRGQFRGDASLRTWLHRILHHLAIDRARHRSHEFSVEDVEERWGADDYTVDASVVAERAESRAEMEDALVHLPVHYRSVVVLHDAEGWTVSDIADVLGLGLPAAKQRLRRGRMMLVEALARGEERRMANRGVGLSCAEARGRVSDYIDDELGPNERAALEAHLAGCVTCPPLYQALVGVTGSLGTLHDPDTVVPSEQVKRIQRRFVGST